MRSSSGTCSKCAAGFEILWWREHITRQLGGALFDYRNAAETAHRAIAASPIIIAAYVVGVLVSVYHLGNGLWTAGSTWGVWTSAAAGRRANFPCAAVGIVLLAVGLGALVGMLRVPAAGATGEVASAAVIALGAAMVVAPGRWRQENRRSGNAAARNLSRKGAKSLSAEPQGKQRCLEN